MGLRLREGVICPPERLELDAVGRLIAQGLLTYDSERLTVTPRGMLLLDAILGEIVRVN